MTNFGLLVNRHIEKNYSLKMIRDSYGITRDQLAFAMKVSPRVLEGWEQGRRSPVPLRHLKILYLYYCEYYYQEAYGFSAELHV